MGELWGHGAVLSAAGWPGVNSVLELSCPVLHHDVDLPLLPICSTVLIYASFPPKLRNAAHCPTVQLPALHKAIEKQPLFSHTSLTASFCNQYAVFSVMYALQFHYR